MNSIETNAVSVSGYVQDRPTQMLVDTGSALLGKMFGKKQTMELNNTCKLVLIPQQMEKNYSYEVYKFGVIREEYPVYVVTPDCLLGADFQNHFGCIVDLAKRTLVAGGKCVSLKLGKRSHSSCHVPFLKTW